MNNAEVVFLESDLMKLTRRIALECLTREGISSTIIKHGKSFDW